MTITIQENLTAKNWTPAAQVPATWGIGPRTITSITTHWWGDPVGQTYAGILDWFCNPKSSVTTSAHFVASDGQVACIVSPGDAAWHAGSPYGNVHSIGIECNPRCSDGDYATVAWLVAQIRSWYGALPLYPHNYWTSTTCPGDYRLDRIDALAGQITAQGGDITPITEDEVTQADIDQIVSKINAYTGALIVSGWSANGVQHPGMALVAEANQKRIDAAAANTAATLTAVGTLATASALAGVATTVNRIDAKPAPTVTVDAAGVQSIADQLKAQLGADVVAAIAAQWAKQ